MADVQRTIELIFAGTDSLSDKVNTISKSFAGAQDNIDNFAEPLASATDRATGARTVGGDKRSGGTVTLPPEQAPTLADLGITKRESVQAHA